jgi:hypothetical protein
VDKGIKIKNNFVKVIAAKIISLTPRFSAVGEVRDDRKTVLTVSCEAEGRVK